MNPASIGVIQCFARKKALRRYTWNKRASGRSTLLRKRRVIDRRTTNYMILGMSLSGLFDLQGNPVEYLKAFNQLLHEYEYHSTHEPGSLSGKPKMVCSVTSDQRKLMLLKRNFFKPVKGAPTRRSEGNVDLYFSGDATTNPSSYTYLNLVNMVSSAIRMNEWMLMEAI